MLFPVLPFPLSLPYFLQRVFSFLPLFIYLFHPYSSIRIYFCPQRLLFISSLLSHIPFSSVLPINSLPYLPLSSSLFHLYSLFPPLLSAFRSFFSPSYQTFLLPSLLPISFFSLPLCSSPYVYSSCLSSPAKCLFLFLSHPFALPYYPYFSLSVLHHAVSLPPSHVLIYFICSMPFLFVSLIFHTFIFFLFYFQ